MSEEISTQEIMEAVTALRGEVEKKGGVDHEMIERVQLVLDGAEAHKQEALKREEESKGFKEELLEYKTKLEESGTKESEAKGRMDALEAEIARSTEKKNVPYKESPEYKAIQTYCIKGVNGLDEEQKALLRTDVAIDGGILAPAEFDTEITKKIVEIDPIRSVARVRTIAAKSMEIPIRNTIPAAEYEGEAETGTDSASTYQSETVTPYRQTFTTPVTMDMLMDSAFDMDSEIAADAGEAFGLGEGQAFVSGDGLKQPEGFLTNSVLLDSDNFRAGGGSGPTLEADDILLLTGDLKTGYNPVYVLNRRTLAVIRTFKATTNSYLWSPGMDGPAANMIGGFPYILANTMPDIAADAFAVAFGDFRRGYTIVDRTGMSVIRDEFTLKKRGIVEFTMNRWNTGRVTLPEAIVLLRIHT